MPSTNPPGTATAAPGTPLLCQDRPTAENRTGRQDCRGAVDFRESLTGTGTPTIRCDGHWADRLDLQDRHRRAGYDSPTPPGWFDSTYAGESWNEPD
jgi:hypothetical protein